MSERPNDADLYERRLEPGHLEPDLEAYKRLRDTYDRTLLEGESLDQSYTELDQDS